MKTKMILIMVLLAAVLVMGTSCNTLGQYIFDNIEIDVEDQENVPAGNFPIPYSIADINTYIEQLGLNVTVTVVDDLNHAVEIVDDSIVVEENRVYTVTITITAEDGQTKSKTMTITAVKSTETYTITYDTMGGTAIAPLTLQSGEDITLSYETAKTGFVLGGWYSDIGLTSPFVLTTMPAEDITVYAEWVLHLGTPSFNGIELESVGANEYVFSFPAADTYDHSLLTFMPSQPDYTYVIGPMPDLSQGTGEVGISVYDADETLLGTTLVIISAEE